MSRRRPRADATRIVALLFVALAMSAAMAALALSLMRRRDAGATAGITQPVAAGGWRDGDPRGSGTWPD